MNANRRRLLQLTGLTAAASTAGLAGCLGDDDDDANGGDDDDSPSYPSYERWLAASDDELMFAYLDQAALEDVPSFDETEAPFGEGDGELTGEDDLMLEMAAVGSLVVGLGVGIGLWGTGLDGIIEIDAEGTAEADFETSIDELLVVNESYVLAGEIDTEEITETLTHEPDDQFSMEAVYEQTDERHGFELYEPAEDEMSPTIAVSEDAIVFAAADGDIDTVDAVTQPLAVNAGDADGATDTLENVGWLLETAGNGQIVFGMSGGLEEAEDEVGEDEVAEDELEGATGLVSSLTIDGDVSAEVAMTFEESIDDDTEAKLEERLGTSADDVTFDVDDDRASVSAVWDSTDVLEE